MTIEDQIKLLENGAESDIKNLDPIQRLNYLVNLKEFVRPKIQRATFEPTTDEDITIKIVYDED